MAAQARAPMRLSPLLHCRGPRSTAACWRRRPPPTCLPPWRSPPSLARRSPLTLLPTHPLSHPPSQQLLLHYNRFLELCKRQGPAGMGVVQQAVTLVSSRMSAGAGGGMRGQGAPRGMRPAAAQQAAGAGGSGARSLRMQLAACGKCRSFLPAWSRSWRSHQQRHPPPTHPTHPPRPTILIPPRSPPSCTTSSSSRAEAGQAACRPLRCCCRRRRQRGPPAAAAAGHGLRQFAGAAAAAQPAPHRPLRAPPPAKPPSLRACGASLALTDCVTS